MKKSINHMMLSVIDYSPYYTPFPEFTWENPGSKTKLCVLYTDFEKESFGSVDISLQCDSNKYCHFIIEYSYSTSEGKMPPLWELLRLKTYALTQYLSKVKHIETLSTWKVDEMVYERKIKSYEAEHKRNFIDAVFNDKDALNLYLDLAADILIFPKDLCVKIKDMIKGKVG